MPQVASANFLEVMRDPRRRVIKRVELSRRIRGTTTIEATPLIFKENEVSSITNISRKFDTRFQNRILLSNVTLVMKNDDWKWIETNLTTGIWRPTAAVTAGFDPYLSEIRLKYGYRLDAEDSEELFTVFTGVITDILAGSKGALVNLPLIGKPELALRDADAQNVSTQFTDEPTVPAVGDTVNDTFKTKKSIWEISKVRVNGVDQVQGTSGDYQLQKVNDADFEAEIVFNAGSEPGAFAVDFTGRQWLRDKTVGELVTAILDEAGIASGDRIVIEPEFPGISQFVEINSQADFEAGLIKQNLDTKEAPGSVIGPWILMDRFDDLDFTSAPPWTVAFEAPSGLPVIKDASTGKFSIKTQDFTDHMSVAASSNARSGVPFSAFGGWFFKMTKTRTTGAGNGVNNHFFFIKNGGTDRNTGYAIEYSYFLNKVFFVIRKSTGAEINLLDLGAIPSGEAVWVITRRTSDSQFRIYSNGTFIGSITDSIISTSDHMGVEVQGSAPNPEVIIDDIYYAPTLDPDNINLSGIFGSAVLDLLAAPDSFSNLVAEQTLNGGTILHETATADAPGGPFDAFIAIGPSDQINSTTRRYIKTRSTMVSGSTFSNAALSPLIASIRLNFSGTSLFVNHADFRGKKGDAAIKRLGELTNSEFGSTGPGVYFFRPKDVGTLPDLVVNQSNFIKEVRGFRTGFDRVNTRVGVTYGKDSQYFTEKTSITESDTAEDRFRKRVLAKTITDFAFSNNADFSAAVARVLRTPFPKRRGQLVCRMIPHLEQSDVLEAGWFLRPQDEDTIFGDELGGMPSFGKAQNVLFRELISKITGIDINWDNDDIIFDIEEILS